MPINTDINKKSLFKRNRIKIIFCFLLLLLTACLLISEYILKNSDILLFNKILKIDDKGANERFIALKEHRPLQNSRLYNMNVVDKKYSRIRLDENGFILPSKIHENPDISIVFLGDSTTINEIVQEEKRFPYLSGKILEESTGKKINSYNAAGNGNNTLHSIDILINKVLPIKPNIVVMMVVGTDLNVLMKNKSYWNNDPDRTPIIEINRDFLIKQIIRQFKHILPNVGNEIQCFVTYVKAHYNTSHNNTALNVVSQPSKENNRKILTFDWKTVTSEYKMNLQTFISICKARNITPVLMTQANMIRDEKIASKDKNPYIYDMLNDEARKFGLTYTESKGLFDTFNNIVRETGRKNNILVIDLDKEIPKVADNFFDPVHFHQKGSILAAEVISRNFLADNNFNQLIQK